MILEISDVLEMLKEKFIIYCFGHVHVHFREIRNTPLVDIFSDLSEKVFNSSNPENELSTLMIKYVVDDWIIKGGNMEEQDDFNFFKERIEMFGFSPDIVMGASKQDTIDEDNNDPESMFLSMIGVIKKLRPLRRQIFIIKLKKDIEKMVRKMIADVAGRNTRSREKRIEKYLTTAESELACDLVVETQNLKQKYTMLAIAAAIASVGSAYAHSLQ